MRAQIVSMVALFTLALTSQGSAAAEWVEGKHYVRIQPALRTAVAPGKVEVAEAFSYGCVYCNQFASAMEQIKASLPKNAEVVYVPASFIPNEQWPMFQRAFYGAQALGIVEKTHQAMFNAVWGTGELAVVDSKTNRLKQPPPTIEGAAKFYERVAGVKAAEFLAVANSFSVEAKMKAADAWIKGAKVSGTPSIVVNGKYRIQISGNLAETTELIRWLVAKESSVTGS